MLGLALIAAMAAGTQTRLIRVFAQDSAPAPTAQAATAQPESASAKQAEQAENSDENEHNVFRHTALVQSLARTFHIDVETMARLFEWINFAVIFLAIVIPLARFLPRMLRRRSETLKHNLEAARQTTADANARLSAVEAQLSKLDDEIAKIRAQVEEESKQDEVRIKASIEDEKTRIVAAAEQEITVAAAQARRGLKHFAADLAIEQAARQLVLTPETDRALIAEFVAEAAGKKGQN